MTTKATDMARQQQQKNRPTKNPVFGRPLVPYFLDSDDDASPHSSDGEPQINENLELSEAAIEMQQKLLVPRGDNSITVREFKDGYFENKTIPLANILARQYQQPLIEEVRYNHHSRSRDRETFDTSTPSPSSNRSASVTNGIKNSISPPAGEGQKKKNKSSSANKINMKLVPVQSMVAVAATRRKKQQQQRQQQQQQQQQEVAMIKREQANIGSNEQHFSSPPHYQSPPYMQQLPPGQMPFLGHPHPHPFIQQHPFPPFPPMPHPSVVVPQHPPQYAMGGFHPAHPHMVPSPEHDLKQRRQQHVQTSPPQPAPLPPSKQQQQQQQQQQQFQPISPFLSYHEHDRPHIFKEADGYYEHDDGEDVDEEDDVEEEDEDYLMRSKYPITPGLITPQMILSSPNPNRVRAQRQHGSPAQVIDNKVRQRPASTREPRDSPRSNFWHRPTQPDDEIHYLDSSDATNSDDSFSIEQPNFDENIFMTPSPRTRSLSAQRSYSQSQGMPHSAPIMHKQQQQQLQLLTHSPIPVHSDENVVSSTPPMTEEELLRSLSLTDGQQQQRHPAKKTHTSKTMERFAGGSWSVSPPPSSLPLPNFAKK